MKVLVTTAMYPTPANPAFGSFVKTQVESLERAGIDVDVLVLQGRSRKLMYPLGVPSLHRRLREDRSIDLVHAHYGLVGMVARAQLKVPLVVTFHGDDILGTVGDHGRLTLPSRVIAAAGKVLGRLADAVIVQSEEMARAFPGSSTHVIPHEVDFDVFRPTPRTEARRALGLDPERPYLLFAANPAIPVKRFPLARDVLSRFKLERPDAELCVVYKETQARLAVYMSACDALLFPSYQEGSPNIVKQAMACGLPIVATDVGDVRLVIEGTEGCHVCEPTIESFVQALRAVLRRNQRTKGREAVRRFEPSLVTARLVEVYEQTLERAGRREVGSSSLVSEGR